MITHRYVNAAAEIPASAMMDEPPVSSYVAAEIPASAMMDEPPTSSLADPDQYGIIYDATIEQPQEVTIAVKATKRQQPETDSTGPEYEYEVAKKLQKIIDVGSDIYPEARKLLNYNIEFLLKLSDLLHV